MNIKSFLFCLSLMVFLYSCKDEVVVDAPEQPIEDVQEDDFPVIIDTVPERLNTIYEFDGVPRAKYKPYYFGALTDSIFIGQSVRYYPPLPSNVIGADYEGDTAKTAWDQFNDYFIFWVQYEELRERGYYKMTDTLGDLSVRFDNSNVIKECYPVIITNHLKDTMLVGDDDDGLDIVMQAINEDGDWQDVEVRYKGCGTFTTFILLPPSESILVLAPIYKGEYITQLRLKLGDFYSKPIMGTINKNQFFDPEEFYK